MMGIELRQGLQKRVVVAHLTPSSRGALAAKQSTLPLVTQTQCWIALRSRSSRAHWRDMLARNDEGEAEEEAQFFQSEIGAHQMGASVACISGLDQAYSTPSAVVWMRSPSRVLRLLETLNRRYQPVDDLEMRLDGGASAACVISRKTTLY